MSFNFLLVFFSTIKHIFEGIRFHEFNKGNTRKLPFILVAV